MKVRNCQICYNESRRGSFETNLAAIHPIVVEKNNMFTCLGPLEETLEEQTHGRTHVDTMNVCLNAKLIQSGPKWRTNWPSVGQGWLHHSLSMRAARQHTTKPTFKGHEACDASNGQRGSTFNYLQVRGLRLRMTAVKSLEGSKANESRLGVIEI